MDTLILKDCYISKHPKQSLCLTLILGQICPVDLDLWLRSSHKSKWVPEDVCTGYQLLHDKLYENLAARPTSVYYLLVFLWNLNIFRWFGLGLS